MRFYSLVNYYLSDLQRGLQTAHAVSEMLVDPNICSHKMSKYKDWAKNHKTIIILNGGNSKQLQETYDQLMPLCNSAGLPITKFHEDEQSLNNALTCVGMVLPEYVYGRQIGCYDGPGSEHVTYSPEQQIFDIVSKFRLA